MDNYQKEIVMGFFLDDNNLATVNKSVILMSDLIVENDKNLNVFNEALSLEKSSEIYDVIMPTLEPPQAPKDEYEHALVTFTDEDYEAIFKAKKTTVKELISFLHAFVAPGNVPLDKKVHVFLMFIMSDLSYNEIGKLFNLHKSTVSHIFQEIGTQFTENCHSFISWPSVEEQHVTRIKVNSRFKFPNCVGFIDTCQLKVGQRKSKYNTILLQAVCDESLMFIDIHIGDMGKIKKNKVFKDSTLSHGLENLIDFDNHLLGDFKYRLRINLITPFTSEELLTSEEMKFNEIHWKARSYIGHAFELLKEKFRKLNHIDNTKPEVIHMLIYSACVLHNFILMHEGSSEFKEETISCDDGITLDTDIVMTAVEKRQFLCNYINYIDSDADLLLSR